MKHSYIYPSLRTFRQFLVVFADSPVSAQPAPGCALQLTDDAAIRLNPQNALAYNNRGLACVNLGDHQRGIEDYDSAIRLYPKAKTPEPSFLNVGR